MHLHYVIKALYEAELTKAYFQHKEPIIVGFLIYQYAKLRVLELYYNFFTNFCDVNMFEKLEMDTDSLYIALNERELEKCMGIEMKAVWEQLLSEDCTDSFTADAVGTFSPKMCCDKLKKFDKREPNLFKEEFRCSEIICLGGKSHCSNNKTSNQLKFCSKVPNRRMLERSSDGLLVKNR